MDNRFNWIMRQIVEIGLFIAQQDGRAQGAAYMADHDVPFDVAQRVLRGVAA